MPEGVGAFCTERTLAAFSFIIFKSEPQCPLGHLGEKLGPRFQGATEAASARFWDFLSVEFRGNFPQQTQLNFQSFAHLRVLRVLRARVGGKEPSGNREKSSGSSESYALAVVKCSKECTESGQGSLPFCIST